MKTKLITIIMIMLFLASILNARAEGNKISIPNPKRYDDVDDANG